MSADGCTTCGGPAGAGSANCRAGAAGGGGVICCIGTTGCGCCACCAARARLVRSCSWARLTAASRIASAFIFGAGSDGAVGCCDGSGGYAANGLGLLKRRVDGSG